MQGGGVGGSGGSGGSGGDGGGGSGGRARGGCSPGRGASSSRINADLSALS